MRPFYLEAAWPNLVAVLYQTWIFLSGDTECSFSGVINISIMLVSVNSVETCSCGSFFFGKRVVSGRPCSASDISDCMTVVPWHPRGQTVLWGA